MKKQKRPKLNIAVNSTYKPGEWSMSTTFDSHSGFSMEECKAVLRFFNLPDRDYFDWMSGQTCPILQNGKMGYYWYDLNRYIRWRVTGVTPIFD
jgi:hypothetical protein